MIENENYTSTEELSKTIITCFEKQVEKSGESVAVKSGTKTMTYAELNVASNRIANALLDTAHGEGDTVVLLFEHGIDMIEAIIGTLKAGKIYVPLDTSYPEDRLEYIMNDAGAGTILTNKKNLKLAERLASSRNVLIVEETTEKNCRNPGVKVNPGKPAYIMYTSGSTGRPKGVVQNHRSIVKLIGTYIDELAIDSTDRIALFTSYSHTVGGIDIFSALFSGAAVYTYEIKEEGSMERLPGWLKKEEITIFHTVPTVYRYFVNTLQEGEIFPKVRLIILGGESVHTVDVNGYKKHFGDECILINLFGSSEVLVAASFLVDKETEMAGNTVPIGYPIDDVELMLLNEKNEKQGVFGVGELVYRSEYLACGYWNMPEKTMEVFSADPTEQGKMLFRSGDLGRMLSDGSIEYLGRKDQQVKIRGNRVEYGEIEAVVDHEKGIEKSVVKAFERENGELTLILYYTLKDGGQIDGEKIKEILKNKLPDYMIPSIYAQIEEIPLTPNGKIDRNALEDLGKNQIPATSNSAKDAYELPGNEMEMKLAGIWEEVLGVKNIGINDNFFAMGGHSLKAITLISKIHKELNIQISLKDMFVYSTIKALTKYLESSKEGEYEFIQNVEEKECYPVSSAQKRLYVLRQMEGASTVYNVPTAIVVEGNLCRIQLEEVFRKLIRRHETLRTSFGISEGEPVQRIYKDVEFNLEYTETEEDKVNEILKGFIRPFELEKAPLFRVGLIKLSKEKHILIIDIHHIITDGTSMNILIKEFAYLYNRQELPELKIQYKDFSAWQDVYLRSEKAKKQEEFWLEKFKGEIPVLNIPTDYRRPLTQSFEGDRINFTVNSTLTGRLNQLTRNNGATLYITLLAACNVLLSKYTGQEDIIVGSPVAGRKHADLNSLVGMFVNTLAMRNKPESHITFETFLERVKENTIKSLENQDYQFEELIEKLELRRDISRNPLFDIMFILQNTENKPLDIKGLNIKTYEIQSNITKFDLKFEAIEGVEGISFNLEYSTKLFKRETMERMVQHFLNILEDIVKNPKKKLYEIDMISEKEKRQILCDFSIKEEKYFENKMIYQLFEEQVEKTPDQLALVFGDKTLTYRELNEKANQLGHLLEEKGAGSDRVIAIMTERSVEMIIGVLSILKAGSAYLPIDPSLPEDRINYMLDICNIKILLTQRRFENKIKFKGQIMDLEDSKIYKCSSLNLTQRNNSNDLAYIIFTSGTTGNPKGVMIEHQSISNTIQWRKKEYKLDSKDNVLQLFSYSFDGFLTSFFTPIVSGAKVILPNEEEAKDPIAIKNLIAFFKITHFICVPILFHVILENLTPEEAKSLKVVTLAGDKISEKTLAKSKEVNEGLEIVNEYGPTESSVATTIYRNLDMYRVSTIGKPITNTRVYIVDNYQNLQPVGIPGELCISGNGLARGYLNMPDLTNKKFIPNPFMHCEKMYRTGDLVKWLPDGNIEFLGRIDDQVKILGYRIELHEIEARLLEMESVNDAVVLVREDDNESKCLCAYITSNERLEYQQIRKHLLTTLPDYMVPSYYVQLDRLPVTSSGKVDRKALPEPDKRSVSGVEYVAPGNELEREMCIAWQSILGVERVGVNDNFFHIGGNSIKAMQLVSNLVMNYEISVNDVFKYPTISTLLSNITFKKNNLISKLNQLKRKAAFIKDEITFDNELKQYNKRNEYYNEVDLKGERTYKNVFITGVTGYLGIHILKYLLEKSNCNVFMLIRGSSIQQATIKLAEKLEYYFGLGIYEEFKDRMHVLNGDITRELFGLPEDIYYKISNEIECIINSAANVKHYGVYNEFHDVNVKGVERLVEFALTGKRKEINHISTMSIASGKIPDKNHMLFTEYDVYIGQENDNYYIKTKIEAERVVLCSREKGLNANIFRVGNIVFQSDTGKFQDNINENAFYNKVKAFIKLGIIPQTDFRGMEFSFVDYVSNSVVTLMHCISLENEIYHIYNPNLLGMAEFATYVKNSGIEINSVTIGCFIDFIRDNYERADLQPYIDQLVLQSDLLENKDNYTNFEIVNQKTNLILSRLGFNWINVGYAHVNRMIRHCKDVKFI